MKNNTKIFVYGTLRDCLHKLVDADFVSLGKFHGKMYHAGRYPAVIPDGKSTIIGSIYSLKNPDEAFNYLDAREGFLYYRQQRDIWPMDKHTVIKCWIYLWNGKTNRLTQINNGYWEQYSDE